MRSKKFFLQTSNGKDLAAQGDLAGHSDIRADGNARQHRYQRGCDRDPCAWSVLRGCAFRHVNVQVGFFVKIRLDPKGLRTLADNRSGRLD